MEVCRKGFSLINKDNDEVFLQQLIGVCESVDELSSMDISKTPYHYHFRLTPSIPSYINPLIKEILKLNNLFGIRLDMGKSIKTSAVINFNIETN